LNNSSGDGVNIMRGSDGDVPYVIEQNLVYDLVASDRRLTDNVEKHYTASIIDVAELREVVVLVIR
jgi:hypothetical protein